MMISLAWVAPVVAAQRMAELWLCRRNRLRQRIRIEEEALREATDRA